MARRCECNRYALVGGATHPLGWQGCPSCHGSGTVPDDAPPFPHPPPGVEYTPAQRALLEDSPLLNGGTVGPVLQAVLQGTELGTGESVAYLSGQELLDGLRQCMAPMTADEARAAIADIEQDDGVERAAEGRERAERAATLALKVRDPFGSERHVAALIAERDRLRAQVARDAPVLAAAEALERANADCTACDTALNRDFARNAARVVVLAVRARQEDGR